MTKSIHYSFNTEDLPNNFNSTNVLEIADSIEKQIKFDIEQYQIFAKKAPKEISVTMGISAYHEVKKGLLLGYEGGEEFLYLFDLHVKVVCSWEIYRNKVEIDIIE